MKVLRLRRCFMAVLRRDLTMGAKPILLPSRIAEPATIPCGTAPCSYGIGRPARPARGRRLATDAASRCHPALYR
jgi:hypothetical protein